MAFYHRKLIFNLFNNTLLPCDFFCDREKNVEGYCPDACVSICDSTCHPFLPLVPPPPCPPAASNYHPNKPPKLSPTLTVSLAILATTFFIFFCYAIYKYFKNRSGSRRRSQAQTEETHDDFLDEDHGPFLDHPIWCIRTVGLQPSIISSITICKYKRGDGLVEGTECSVCLSEFQEDETLRLLPKCNHAFHIPCIDTWLRSHTNCPMCRAGIVSNLAGLPSPEQSVENSGLEEETQVGISENNIEFGRETEDGACELRIGIDEGGELQVESETKEEVGSSEHSEMDEDQPMRRSVSMNSLSASMISLAIAHAFPVQSEGNSDTQSVKLNESNVGIVPKGVDVNQGLIRVMGSSSIGRSLSCSGKFFLSSCSIAVAVAVAVAAAVVVVHR
ncbi:hypothetical protein F0562_028905 [Nyssa sinensis]|uniref:RING-type E3 ubiquitin transferase n=1 Tax=Nyssa sinensis TaxID=561372 RepID=A0A5J5B3P2_9ASTE|nr:hypothetical protein F0562_028905 [Nyssa sinensis]